MKNLVYAMGLLPLLMSAGAEAQSHARASATGAVNIKGIELSIEEQVRESFADIQPGAMPSYNHTQIGLSTGLYKYFAIGVAARNTIESGEMINRIQADASAKYAYEGLYISTRLMLQEDLNSDRFFGHDVDGIALRNKATMGYDFPTIYNMKLGVHMAEEHFLTTAGLSENRIFVGSTLTLYENYSLVSEYFLQTEGEILGADMKIGEYDNNHVVALNLKAAF